jgi:hypothetical protein
LKLTESSCQSNPHLFQPSAFSPESGEIWEQFRTEFMNLIWWQLTDKTFFLGQTFSLNITFHFHDLKQSVFTIIFYNHFLQSFLQSFFTIIFTIIFYNHFLQSFLQSVFTISFTIIFYNHFYNQFLQSFLQSFFTIIFYNHFLQSLFTGVSLSNVKCSRNH